MVDTTNPYIAVLRRALDTALWVMKIVVPTSFVVMLLNFYGVITWLSSFAEPLFSLIGLPGKAAVVYISGLCLPLYVPLALMSTLSLNLREVTILALMCLTAHNLPVESAVQRKCGLQLAVSLPLRIGFSLLGGALLNLLVPAEVALLLPSIARSVLQPVDLWGAVSDWFISTASLCVKLLVIVTLLMFLQDYLKRHGILQLILKPLAPFMIMCGLKPSSSFMWLIANIVGLTYGAGIMAQEVQEADADRRELRLVNAHIALNHSLLEDTAIFAMIGVGWYWLIIPRLCFALIAVWSISMLELIRKN